MDHRGVGCLELLGTCQIAVFVHYVERHVLGDHAISVIAEKQHLACFGIYFRVGRHRPFELAVVGPCALGLERDGVQLKRSVPFFQGEQLAAVP